MNKEKRKQELFQLLHNDKSKEKLLTPLIDNILKLEEQLEIVQQLPLISFNKRCPEQQRLTPAAKLITSLTAQYTSALRVFHNLCGNIGDVSPLRAYLEKINGKKDDTIHE